MGAILSYLIIAIALFGGKYDSLSLTELGAQISRVGMVWLHFIYIDILLLLFEIFFKKKS